MIAFLYADLEVAFRSFQVQVVGIKIDHVMTVDGIATTADGIRLDGFRRRILFLEDILTYDPARFPDIEHEWQVIGVLKLVFGKAPFQGILPQHLRNRGSFCRK